MRNGLHRVHRTGQCIAHVRERRVRFRLQSGLHSEWRCLCADRTTDRAHVDGERHLAPSGVPLDAPRGRRWGARRSMPRSRMHDDRCGTRCAWHQHAARRGSSDRHALLARRCARGVHDGHGLRADVAGHDRFAERAAVHFVGFGARREWRWLCRHRRRSAAQHGARVSVSRERDRCSDDRVDHALSRRCRRCRIRSNDRECGRCER